MFSLLILMMLVPLMSLATKKQPVGGGQCFKRDWMAQCISYSVWKITNEASEILTVSFGSIETLEKEGLLEKKSTKNEYSGGLNKLTTSIPFQFWCKHFNKWFGHYLCLIVQIHPG